jgi:hypothetical protein
LFWRDAKFRRPVLPHEDARSLIQKNGLEIHAWGWRRIKNDAIIIGRHARNIGVGCEK